MDSNISIDVSSKTDEVEHVKWYKAFYKKRLCLLFLVPISFFILWLAKSNTDIAEYVFARGIVRWISKTISLITGILPISVMEVEIIAVPVLTIIFISSFFFKIIKTKKKSDIPYVVSKEILNVVCALSLLLFIYVLFAGVNYYRYSFATFNGLEVKESTVEELYYLNLELANKAADIREQLHLTKGTEDENGVLQLSNMKWSNLTKTATDSFNKISLHYPMLGGNYGSPKPVFFSKFMSRMEITGIFWPFTLEANVNTQAAQYSIPATMSHEMAHVRGFMREDEANFIAYLVCKQSDSLAFQYSGIMLALSYANNQLYRQSPDLYQKVEDSYNEGMLADLRDEYYYWKQFEDTIISTVSTTMNDNYLRANNQTDGVKSYGRMVDLLLAEYRKNLNTMD